VPVLDCLRLIVLRIGKGRSPFSADLHHLHHYLARRLPWNAALPVYLAISAGPGFLALAWPAAALELLLVTTLLYLGLLLWTRRPVLAVPVAEPVRQE
jgi:UDP-GlcNAc:undecaprenyl-phosphate/decaprenyl-phosphate GlcNAc-1-phosphate transferase